MVHEATRSATAETTAMTTDITIIPLAPERVAEALPLVRELAADMTAERFEDYVTRLTSPNGGAKPRGGIIVAQSANGYLRGLLGYRITDDLCRGPTLVAENMIVPGAFHGSLVSALIDALDGLAKEYGCTVIEARLPPNDHGIVGMARRRGFGFDGWRLSKALTQKP